MKREHDTVRARAEKARALRVRLFSWRAEEARRYGIPEYRVLTSVALSEVAARMPVNRDELLSIKGIKEKKFFQYGAEILRMVALARAGEMGDTEESIVLPEHPTQTAGVGKTTEEAYSVSAYLSLVNDTLATIPAQIVGEVGSIDVRDTYIFFTLKDARDGSTLPCFMWMSDYRRAGYEVEPGNLVSVLGVSEVWKPAGRFSFHARSIALHGEGALKKAYDALRKKLDREGVFSDTRKRSIPDFPIRVGLLTSRQGAAIGDFLNNLERWGFSVRFAHSRVEGAHAVEDILSSLDILTREHLDVLVIIRGGGSMESLQAFNHEGVVRAVAAFPAPVICGIGHDRDVPLVALAADMAVSTPTATAVLLSSRFREAWRAHETIVRNMTSVYVQALSEKRRILDTHGEFLSHRMEDIASLVRSARDGIAYSISRMAEHFSLVRHRVAMEGLRLSNLFTRRVDECRARIVETETALVAWDPQRALARGYAIVRAQAGNIVARARGVRKGDDVDITLADGTIKATVTSVSTR